MVIFELNKVLVYISAFPPPVDEAGHDLALLTTLLVFRYPRKHIKTLILPGDDEVEKLVLRGRYRRL